MKSLYDLLKSWIKKRDCEHVWYHIGFDVLLEGTYSAYLCPKCKAEKSIKINSPTLDKIQDRRQVVILLNESNDNPNPPRDS